MSKKTCHLLTFLKNLSYLDISERPKPEPEPKSFRFGSGSVIFTETGMGSHSSIHSKKSLTARPKKFGISIILYKNLLNRVILLYCRKNLPLFFFKYIASSEILKTFTILIRYWVSVPVRFRLGKKSIFRFRSIFGEIPFRLFTIRHVYLQSRTDTPF